MDAPALPADARRSLFVYNLCFPLVFLALLPGFLLRMVRRGGFRDRFGQRLGWFSVGERAQLSAGGWIWVHSISVGETFIALKLVRELHAQHPTARVLLSTTTTTGQALAREQEAEWLRVIYNPVDFRPVVRRTLALLRPAQIVLIEGEAWPNLLAESRRMGIPVALVNARLSPRSERRFRRFRAWTGPIFRLLHRILVPEPGDLPRWESLGVPGGMLRCTGSIKFDQAASGGASRAGDFRRLLPAGDYPILVAGSTHAGEEKLLAEMLPRLRAAAPGLLLIITPRHVERVPALLRELAELKLRTARRSELPAAEPFDLLVVDTTGELRDWYALATVVFVGKSLTAIGGQNPAEPALLGKPVVVGPHMENFAGVMEHLLAAGGIVQAADAAEGEREVARLLGDAAARGELAQRAAGALTAHQGATAKAAADVRRL